MSYILVRIMVQNMKIAKHKKAERSGLQEAEHILTSSPEQETFTPRETSVKGGNELEI